MPVLAPCAEPVARGRGPAHRSSHRMPVSCRSSRATPTMPEFDLTVLTVGAGTDAVRVVPDVNTLNTDAIDDVQGPLTQQLAAHHPAP
jgi:hypothetical protein